MPDLERLLSRIHGGSCSLADFLLTLNCFTTLKVHHRPPPASCMACLVSISSRWSVAHRRYSLVRAAVQDTIEGCQQLIPELKSKRLKKVLSMGMLCVFTDPQLRSSRCYRHCGHSPN